MYVVLHPDARYDDDFQFMMMKSPLHCLVARDVHLSVGYLEKSIGNSLDSPHYPQNSPRLI